MLNVIKCPNCQKRIATDQNTGQTIPCPYCEEVFTITRAHAAGGGATREALFRLAIPLGYVLFVAVPLALTIWFFANRVEEKQKETAKVTEPPPAQTAINDKADTVRRPPAPRPPKKRPPSGPGTTDPEPVPEPAPVPMPSPAVELALAPPPRELPEVFVAPEPREIAWKLPPLEHPSPWQKVGAVEVRLAGVAVTRVPIIDGNKSVRDSARPMLVVVVEVRMSTTTKKRDLLSWTYGQNCYGTIFLAGGKVLPPFDIPLGSRLHSGLPLKQPIPADGKPVRDVLVFDAPSDTSGGADLRLDAERCGESGDLWFKIPAGFWKK